MERTRALFGPRTRQRLRLFLSAVLSFVDVASDVFSIANYYEAGRPELASALLGVVLLSLAIQIAVVCVAHMHQGVRILAIEILIVLSGFKPFVDVWRIDHGMENAGSPLDTRGERVYCKGIEVVCEALPSAIIQITDALVSSRVRFAPFFSICTSFVAIAVTSTSIFFSFDTDPENRLLCPQFYGAVPASPIRHFSTRVSAFLFQLLHTVSKLVCVSLLLVTSSVALAAYLVLGIAAYVAYKVARKDWYCWIPGAGVGLSVPFRVLPKVFVDFTGNPQLRHPNELGAACWLLTMFETQATCMLSGVVYSRFYDSANKLNDGTLFAWLGGLLAAWIAALAVFLLSINRQYLRTFVSFETGPQFIQRMFRENESNDQRRIQIFLTNENHWVEIRPSVAYWVENNVGTWVGQVWFVEAVRTKIPDDMLPRIDLL
jgi:hypothetical protein